MHRLGVNRRWPSGRGALLWPVAALFAVNGIAIPSWLPRIPEVRDRLGLDAAALGLALTGLAAGALLASPVAGRLVGRWGAASVAQLSGAALALLLWLPGVVGSGVQLFGALAVLGALDGVMDVAMNTVGAAREKVVGRSVMHRLHGAWSAGMLLAALVGGAAAALGLSVGVHLLSVGLALLVVLATARPMLRELPLTTGATTTGATTTRDVTTMQATTTDAPVTRDVTTLGIPAAPAAGTRGPRRTRVVLLLGGATLLAGLVESAPADWGALQLRGLGAGRGAAAWAVVATSAGMVGGRLVGDALTDRYGPGRVVRAGAVLAAAGLLGGMALGHPIAAALGFGAVGLGMSVYFPLAFSVGGSVDGVSPGAGAAIVSTGARLGFLLGPVAIGFLAASTSLRVALGAVASVAAVLAAIGPWFDRHRHRAAP